MCTHEFLPEADDELAMSPGDRIQVSGSITYVLLPIDQPMRTRALRPDDHCTSPLTTPSLALNRLLTHSPTRRLLLSVSWCIMKLFVPVVATVLYSPSCLSSQLTPMRPQTIVPNRAGAADEQNWLTGRNLTRGGIEGLFPSTGSVLPSLYACVCS